MKKYLLLIVLLPVFASAQISGWVELQREIKIDTKVDEDKIVYFVDKKARPGCYTFIFEKGEVFVVRREGEEFYRGRAALGSYMYMRGWLDPHVQKDFVYLLPFASGEPHRVDLLRSKDDRMVSYLFEMREGDDVYAMRKGVVIDIGEDRIEVEHNDGTRACYSGMAEGTVEVKIGQTVYPDTALGEVKRDLVVSAYWLTASTYRLAGVMDLEHRTVYKTLEPVFMTTDGGRRLVDGGRYAAVATDKLVGREMTRREKMERK